MGTKGFKGSRARKATTSSATVASSRSTKKISKDSQIGPPSKRRKVLRDGTDDNITSDDEGSPEKAAGTQQSRNKGKQRKGRTGKVTSGQERKGRKSQTKDFSEGRGEKRGSGSRYSGTVERQSRTKRASDVDPSGTESSGSEEAEPSGGSVRSRKKRRRSESDRTAESSDSGGEKGMASAQEVTVSSARWKPVSEEACKVLSSAMLSAFGQCVTGLSGSRRQQAERVLQEVTRRVTQKLQSATGPTAGRMKSYSGVKQNVAELKEKCLRLTNKNSELERSLEDRERITADIEARTEQLLDAISSAPTPSSPAEFPDPPEDDDTDEDAFMNYVVDLVENSRVASSRSWQQKKLAAEEVAMH